MKKKWFRSLELVDDEFLEEANPDRQVTPLRKKRIITTLVASAACLALTVTGLWLFWPHDNTPPSIEHHEKNEYYAVIEKLNALKQEPPKYDNNFQIFEDWVDDIFQVGVKGDVMENATPDAAVPGDRGDGNYTGSTNDGSTYEEITDNQVEGITEADRIKRSNTHIYYLDGNTLKIFNIAGLETEMVGSVTLDETTYTTYLLQWEFYLSADCKTATVFTRYPNAQKQLCVGVISVDVSDPTNPTVKNKLEITGNYLSSRVTDGKILLMTEFVPDRTKMDFEKEETFLPQIDGASIPAADIILPEDANSARYTVVLQLDENTLQVEGKAAFLSYTKHIYVSHDHIFLTHVYADKKTENYVTTRNSMTEITALSYKDGFAKRGSVTVRGYVKDQWSMDEYEGILRVVTTTNATKIHETASSSGNVSADILQTATGESNASLYCIDLKEFKVVASVEDFAPPREEVRSVRFDKTTAYVCTAIEVSDPVYFFDLSDLKNITYKETGTIDGFSSSLINIGEGYLLGIGRENWNTFKVEVYKETETGVESHCKFTQQDMYYSENYKSYYIDRENRLIGLGLWGGRTIYVLLYFDGYELLPLQAVPINGEPEQLRGVCIDGFMYIFGENAFKVVNVKTGQTNKSTHTIEKIYDIAKRDNIPCDTGMEEFWKDGENAYYFSCIKSQYIKVVYWDGSSEDIVTALSNGHATIADLDRFQIEYYAKPHK